MIVAKEISSLELGFIVIVSVMIVIFYFKFGKLKIAKELFYKDIFELEKIERIFEVLYFEKKHSELLEDKYEEKQG